MGVVSAVLSVESINFLITSKYCRVESVLCVSLVDLPLSIIIFYHFSSAYHVLPTFQCQFLLCSPKHCNLYYLVSITIVTFQNSFCLINPLKDILSPFFCGHRLFDWFVTALYALIFSSRLFTFSYAIHLVPSLIPTI